MTKPMWMVRAATGGRLADEFKDKGVVAIGWHDIGDLTKYKDKQSILKAVAQAWPDWSTGGQMSSASQLIRFRDELQIGDRVITYDSSRRMYHVGTIKSGYVHSPNTVPPYENAREVRWEGEVERDKLSLSTRNRLGSTLTLFRVPEQAADEIELALKGKSVPSPVIEEAEGEDEKSLLNSYKSEAFEIIKDRVNRLGWEEMQELVAALLRAMGYKTRVAERGPDRGIDIMASPDGFGFESPRIIVEVKHRTSAISAPQLRSFLDVCRHQDDKGLYVSTSGFSKEALYEADRARVPVMLLDIDALVKAILRHYESMDMDGRNLLPLKKIYWPV